MKYYAAGFFEKYLMPWENTDVIKKGKWKEDTELYVSFDPNYVQNTCLHMSGWI